MKKNIVAALAASMLLACLMMTACGGSAQTETPGTTVEQTTESATQETPSQEAPTQESLPISGDIVTLEDGTLILPDGHAIKPEYPINETAIGKAVTRFQYLYDSYLAGTDSAIHVAIIPTRATTCRTLFPPWSMRSYSRWYRTACLMPPISI